MSNVDCFPIVLKEEDYPPFPKIDNVYSVFYDQIIAFYIINLPFYLLKTLKNYTIEKTKEFLEIIDEKIFKVALAYLVVSGNKNVTKIIEEKNKEDKENNLYHIIELNSYNNRRKEINKILKTINPPKYFNDLQNTAELFYVYVYSCDRYIEYVDNIIKNDNNIAFKIISELSTLEIFVNTGNIFTEKDFRNIRKGVLLRLFSLGKEKEIFEGITKKMSKKESSKILSELVSLKVKIPEEYKEFYVNTIFMLWTNFYFFYLYKKFGETNCVFIGNELFWDCDNKIMCDLKIYRDNEYTKECIIKSSRFVIFPLVIQVGEPLAHQNLIVYDKKTNIVERFDPHGSDSKEVNNQELRSAIIKYITNMTNHEIVEYFEPYHYCPYNFQGIEQETPNIIIGTCQVWSFIYAFFRLKYPNMERNDVINYIMNFITDKGAYNVVKTILYMFLEIIEKHNKRIDYDTIFKNVKDIEHLDYDSE